MRKLLLAGDQRLDDRGRNRMLLGLRVGDPHDEVLGAWLAKESVREVRIARRAFDHAATDARKAIALGGGASALEVAGWVAYYQRRYDEAHAYADEAAVRSTDLAVRASALALAGRIRHALGDLAGAIEHLTGVEGAPSPALRGMAFALPAFG